MYTAIAFPFEMHIETRVPMKKSEFLLKEARELVISKPSFVEKKSNRRQFLKALGIGTLAVNPALGAVKKFTNEPFSVDFKENQLHVWRNGALAWEISNRFFSSNTQISIRQIEKGWQFQINSFNFKGTHFTINLQGTLIQALSQWLINIQIPEFNWTSEMDFVDFLDGIKPLSADASIDSKMVQLNNSDHISINHKVLTTLSPEWQMQFSSENAIDLNLHGKSLHTHALKIVPGFDGTLPFYNDQVKGSLVQMSTFSSWPELMTAYTYKGKSLVTGTEKKPTLQILTGNTETQDLQLLWIDGMLHKMSVKGTLKDPINLQDYFFFQDLKDEESNFYLSARLESKGQWVSNGIGSFQLSRNEEAPDFEVFGMGLLVQNQILKPRLKAFHPKMNGGLSTTSVFPNAPVVHITDQKNDFDALKSRYFFEPPQDTTRNKTVIRGRTNLPVKTDSKTKEDDKKNDVKVIREIKVEKEVVNPKEVKIETQKDLIIDKVPEIQVENDRKIKFIPRLPLNIRILRPDDLVWLEVQFKNFKFVNGRTGNSMLELEDKSKPGTLTYSFPTQHTLEEAYFETTPMDTAGNQEIKLPARHIRAKKSRLVYEYEAGKPGFELTIHELLDWSKFTLKVHPRAYIKLPTVVLKPVGKPVTTSKANLIKTENLNTKNNFYQTQIVEKSRHKVDKLTVYDKAVVDAVLPANIAPTLEPAFNLNYFKLPLKVEPIPETHTSIEAPALMYISPNQVNDFSHKIDAEYRDTEEIPVVKTNTTLKQVKPLQVRLNPIYTNKGQITELWHTSLGIKLKNNRVAFQGMDKLKTIRALWAFDANSDYKGCALIDEPFQASLDASDRHKLVHTTSNYEIQGFTPFPVPVKKLMLTGLGSYLDWHAFFDVPTPIDNHLNIIEWEHLATLGRDHYVKVVREGYLFPVGHRAALVKVTERKFDAGTKAAVNKMRMYIVILEKEVLYKRNDPANKFIKFPFQAIKIENDYTPNINKPVQIALDEINIQLMKVVKIGVDCPQKPGRSSTYNFYINVNSKPFLFDITATDKEGNEHRIQMPLAFVENLTGRSKSMVEKMVANYNPQKNLNEVPFNGQQVAYAECLVDGDTTFETKKLSFGGQFYPASDEGDLKFHPIMQTADIYIKAVDELTGKREPASIQLEDDSNQGMVFAKVSGAEVDFSGGSDKSGGFMMPNMSISGLSKLQGPIGGKVEDMMNLNFVPTEFFKIVGDLPMAKIFGVIDIISLLLDKPNIGNSLQTLINQIKKFKEEVEKIKDEILMLQQKAKETGEILTSSIEEKKALLKAKAVEIMNTLNNQMPKVPNLKTWFTTEAFFAEYKWIPEFSSSDINLFGDLLQFHVDKPKEALQITTTFSKPFDGLTSATLDGKAELSNFNIAIKDALKVNFSSMKFISGSSKKTDVKVDLNKSKPIEFIGALSFVNNLQDLIPSTGFSDDGPYVNLTMAGVKAGFDISIPDVEVGVFALSNMTLGAYINLPFNGDELTMGFNFCTRENPFLLTVSGFGGGGYFLMITTLKGLKSVEAAFEFGASVSINLGVASGGVSIMGGFYFKYEMVAEKETINLSGYIRINGRLSILGIISVSLEFYLALNAVYETVQLGNGSSELKVTKMEGVATLKVKIEILFFSKTVKVTVRREFAGADADPTFAQMVLPEDWNEYCLAFA
jgi:hypothetical protein